MSLGLRDFLEPPLVAAILALFVRTWLLQIFAIPTASMEPNLAVGDHLWVNKFVYSPVVEPWEERWLPVRDPQRGDVVVFRYPPEPERFYIKRCLGLAGETVTIEDKALSIDGVEIREEGYAVFVDETVYSRSLFLEDGFRKRDNYGPYVVPPGHAFCLGDNRDDSNDSRVWGPVSRDLMRGQALAVLWRNSSGRAAGPRGETEEESPQRATPRWVR
ncbi:MAG: signal peptidase I [Acidobacteriota bacterium]